MEPVIKDTEDLIRILQKHGTTWHDKAKLIEAYHLKQLEQHGHRNSKSDPGWSMRLTAEYLKVSVSYICQAIKVAEMLRAKPRIQYEYNSIHDAYTEKGKK